MGPGLQPNSKLAAMIHTISFTQLNVFEVVYFTQNSVFKELVPVWITCYQLFTH